jgi:hypothetical protein
MKRKITGAAALAGAFVAGMLVAAAPVILRFIIFLLSSVALETTALEQRLGTEEPPRTASLGAS